MISWRMWRYFIIAISFPGFCHAQGPLKGANGEFVPMPGVDYFCTDSTGQRREIGEVTCLVASSCQKMIAKCDMSANSPMWRKLQEGCPAAALTASPAGRLFQMIPTTPKSTVAGNT